MMMGRKRIAVCEMMVVDGRGKQGIQRSYVRCTDCSNQPCRGSVFSTRRGEVVVRVGGREFGCQWRRSVESCDITVWGG